MRNCWKLISFLGVMDFDLHFLIFQGLLTVAKAPVTPLVQVCCAFTVFLTRGTKAIVHFGAEAFSGCVVGGLGGLLELVALRAGGLWVWGVGGAYGLTNECNIMQLHLEASALCSMLIGVS